MLTRGTQPLLTRGTQPLLIRGTQPLFSRSTQPLLTRGTQPLFSRSTQPLLTIGIWPLLTRGTQPLLTRGTQPLLTRGTRPLLTHVSPASMCKQSTTTPKLLFQLYYNQWTKILQSGNATLVDTSVPYQCCHVRSTLELYTDKKGTKGTAKSGKRASWRASNNIWMA